MCAVSLITEVSPTLLVINGRHSLENMEDSNNNEAEIEHEWLKSQLNLGKSADPVKVRHAAEVLLLSLAAG